MGFRFRLQAEYKQRQWRRDEATMETAERNAELGRLEAKATKLSSGIASAAAFMQSADRDDLLGLALRRSLAVPYIQAQDNLAAHLRSEIEACETRRTENIDALQRATRELRALEDLRLGQARLHRKRVQQWEDRMTEDAWRTRSLFALAKEKS